MDEDTPDPGLDDPSDEERDDEALDDEALDPREAARMRRRDHDAEGERRALMRTGMGKVFKQILDRQVREADDVPSGRPRHRPRT
jgi:hypothetical protein